MEAIFVCMIYIHCNTGCTTFQMCCEALLMLKCLVLNNYKIDFFSLIILCFDMYFVLLF